MSLPLLHQLWSIGWNEKTLNGSTMRGRSDDPSHYEGRRSTTELHLAPKTSHGGGSKGGPPALAGTREYKQSDRGR